MQNQKVAFSVAYFADIEKIKQVLTLGLGVLFVLFTKYGAFDGPIRSYKLRSLMIFLHVLPQ